MIAILDNNGHCTDFFYMFNCRTNIKQRLEREIQTHTATLIKHRLGTYIAGVTYNITNIIYI